jgi:hypothetical protein
VQVLREGLWSSKYEPPFLAQRTREKWGTRHHAATASMLDPFQVFLTAGVGMRKRESSAEFLGGSAAVALVFE